MYNTQLLLVFLCFGSFFVYKKDLYVALMARASLTQRGGNSHPTAARPVPSGARNVQTQACHSSEISSLNS